jgi:uncharacterized membrane protein YebE (DUF533 family)
MLDARKILSDLQHQAEAIAREVRDSGAVDKAKKAAGDLRERLKTDPKAQAIAAGAGGLLLLGLLGSKGGRRLTGDIAKTGAVAALGALAYKTWMERHGKTVDEATLVRDAGASGFPIDPAADPDFALAVVRTMLAAAYADGVIDAAEQRIIDGAKAKAQITEDERRMLAGEIPEEETLRLIAGAAKTPHHAAELYAAAVISAGELNDRESAFLKKLAGRLGLTPDEAGALQLAAAKG